MMTPFDHLEINLDEARRYPDPAFSVTRTGQDLDIGGFTIEWHDGGSVHLEGLRSRTFSVSIGDREYEMRHGENMPMPAEEGEYDDIFWKIGCDPLLYATEAYNAAVELERKRLLGDDGGPDFDEAGGYIVTIGDDTTVVYHGGLEHPTFDVTIRDETTRIVYGDADPVPVPYRTVGELRAAIAADPVLFAQEAALHVARFRWDAVNQ